MKEAINLFRMPLSPIGSEEWTEEQWAEHDAKIAEQRAIADAQERADDARAKRSRLEDHGWPRRAIDAADAADVDQAALAKVLTWDHQATNVLVLSGPPGCGKTTAAAHWAIRYEWTTRFLRATTFAAGSRYDEEKRDRWLKAHALVLDDLGAEYADTKGNFLVDLDELVDTFYGDRRPLIVTTNCTAAEFKTRYGSRVVDRFRECGIWYEIAGKSLRVKS